MFCEPLPCELLSSELLSCELIMRGTMVERINKLERYRMPEGQNIEINLQNCLKAELATFSVLCKEVGRFLRAVGHLGYY